MRLTDLPEVSTVSNDQVTVVDGATGTKKITFANFVNNVVAGLSSVISGKLDKSDVVNNLTTTTTGKALDASQGKALNDGKAPNAHASSATTYGVGTGSNYGHCKIINNLTTSSNTNGYALSAYQGKVLNDKIAAIRSGFTTVTWGTWYIGSFSLGAGNGGGYYTASFGASGNIYSNSDRTTHVTSAPSGTIIIMDAEGSWVNPCGPYFNASDNTVRYKMNKNTGTSTQYPAPEIHYIVFT